MVVEIHNISVIQSHPGVIITRKTRIVCDFVTV